MTTPTTIRTAQITALFLSSTVSGISLALSTFLVPRLLESPVPTMLLQWKRTYHAGKTQIAPAAAAASAIWFWLAAKSPALTRGVGRQYLAAGALAFAIIPYTGVMMMETNRRIEERAEGVSLERGRLIQAEGKGDEEEQMAWVRGEGSKYLVDWWGMLNLGRSAMLMASTVVGLVAVV